MTGVMETVFDSSRLPSEDRVEAWLEVSNRALVTAERSFPYESGPFHGRLRTTCLGEVQLAGISYSPVLARRTPKMIRQSDPEHLMLSLGLAGEQGFDQARTRNLLTPGSLLLHDSSQPFT